MSSRLLGFYRLEAPDSGGRMLWEYWAWDDETLEHRHDFIQWMFPLNEPSGFNPEAPLVTEEDVAAFLREPVLRSAVLRSLGVFMKFVGLVLTPDGRVERSENFHQRLAVWSSPNHNWLRITRMLKSLRLLGFEAEAGAIWKCLRKLHEENGYVSQDSFGYWRDAAKGLDSD